MEQNLLVDSCAPEAGKGGCRALDSSIRFGQVYEYRAQRVARVAVEGKTLELASELSAPVRVEALDIFPPAVPTGLAAVATTGENGAGRMRTLPDTPSIAAKAMEDGSVSRPPGHWFPRPSTTLKFSRDTFTATPSAPSTRADTKAPAPRRPRRRCPTRDGLSRA